MRREIIFGRPVCLQGSPLTLLIYQQEFSGDLAAHDGDFAAQLSDLLRTEEQDGEPVFFVNYLGFLRIAWAMARTYDKKVPNFQEWLGDFPEEAFHLTDGGDELVAAINRIIDKEIFVSERPYKQDPNDDEEDESDLDPKWNVYKNILILKRAGFTLDEIREMTMADFIAYTDIFAGARDDTNKGNKGGKAKEATQADIDKLFPV